MTSFVVFFGHHTHFLPPIARQVGVNKFQFWHPLWWIIFLTLSFSCSKEREKTRTTFSLANLVAGISDVQYAGGVYLWARRFENSQMVEVRKLRLESGHEVEIPFGQWIFTLVAFVGPGTYSGDSYCGLTGLISLDGALKDVEVFVDQNSCSENIFIAMMAEIGVTQSGEMTALWGQSLWGQGKWGP